MGCLCQWELKAPTDRSRSDCVHEQVAKRIANVRFTNQKKKVKQQQLKNEIEIEKLFKKRNLGDKVPFFILKV